ncbi:MAG: LLM class flavin-dependent oxidoreductase [Pseudomonadota bacterium]
MWLQGPSVAAGYWNNTEAGYARGAGSVTAAYRLRGDGRVGLDVALKPSAIATPGRIGDATGSARVRFGLFFFGNDTPPADSDRSPRYELLLAAAERTDTAGLEAIWTPERQFGVFGGRYPSPVATPLAIAVRTTQIAIRAGSLVLPLHHPVRVAEDWAVIDNLSGGRVGVSFASGTAKAI